tara:strand:+ start:810 stop:1094 length:285 start_codon:yes stop_codon:yes gene_type:complete
MIDTGYHPDNEHCWVNPQEKHMESIMQHLIEYQSKESKDLEEICKLIFKQRELIMENNEEAMIQFNQVMDKLEKKAQEILDFPFPTEKHGGINE